MMKKEMSIALAAAMLTIAGTAAQANAAGTEKCYGVAKAGHNDCAGGRLHGSTCAGTSKIDREADAFLMVPKGLCNKLSGGTLKPGSDIKK